MTRSIKVLTTTLAAALAMGGCATRSGDIAPAQASPADFATWRCERIHDESDRVQKRAAELAYTVDERAGNNIIALGIGLTVFWPALIAMRPPGPEAEELARLKGRYEALQLAVQSRPCEPPSATLSTERAAALPVVLGDRLVYEERSTARGPMHEMVLRVTALRRGELEFRVEPGLGVTAGIWTQDYSGNVTRAPAGALQWPQLLRQELELGQVLGGEIAVAQAPARRARVRGQVVAVGPQTVAGRTFDVAVIELFGDAGEGVDSARLDGVLVIDRKSGVLLRLDLRSPTPGFMLQRRLARVEAVSR
jgi:hypothetical protein